MTTALIGLLGIFLGIILNEYFRRKNRIEVFSPKIFEERLKIYEKLLLLVHEKSSLISDVIESLSYTDELTIEMAHEICFKEGLEVIEFCDKNQLYLNDEITVQVGATFVTTGDILDSKDEKQKELLNDFFLNIKELKEMIKSESGMDEINYLKK